MRIGATISSSLQSLSKGGPLQADYVEVNGEQDITLLQSVLASFPVQHVISGSFWLNYENPFDEKAFAKAHQMLTLASPPWHSTGIGASAEPQGNTTEFWRGALAGALQPRQCCLENIVRNGKRLQEWLGIPLLLENNNYHPTNAYEYVCEPEPAAGWSMKSAATCCSTWRTLRSAPLIWGGQTHATICWPYP